NNQLRDLIPMRIDILNNIGGLAGGALGFLVVRGNRPAAANANPGNPGLLAVFDGDPDFNGPLFVAAVNGDLTNVGQAITTANGGSFMALSDGGMDYVAPDGFYDQDSVDYTVSD